MMSLGRHSSSPTLATVVQIQRFPVERKIGNLDLSLKSPIRLLSCFDSNLSFMGGKGVGKVRQKADGQLSAVPE